MMIRDGESPWCSLDNVHFKHLVEDSVAWREAFDPCPRSSRTARLPWLVGFVVITRAHWIKNTVLSFCVSCVCVLIAEECRLDCSGLFVCLFVRLMFMHVVSASVFILDWTLFSPHTTLIKSLKNVFQPQVKNQKESFLIFFCAKAVELLTSRTGFFFLHSFSSPLLAPACVPSRAIENKLPDFRIRDAILLDIPTESFLGYEVIHCGQNQRPG